MEIKMKAICDGRTTRINVVHESLDMYRDVYIRTTRQLNVMKAVCLSFQHATRRVRLANS